MRDWLAVFPGFDGVAGRFDFGYGAAIDGLVPAMELHAGGLPIERGASEDGPELVYNVVGFLYLGMLAEEQVHPLLRTFTPLVWRLCKCASAVPEYSFWV